MCERLGLLLGYCSIGYQDCIFPKNMEASQMTEISNTSLFSRGIRSIKASYHKVKTQMITQIPDPNSQSTLLMRQNVLQVRLALSTEKLLGPYDTEYIKLTLLCANRPMSMPTHLAQG